MIAEFLKETSNRPFEFGKCDCILWPADLVLAATGQDPAAEFRGQYNSAVSYKRLVRRHGGTVAICDRMMADFRRGCVENGVGLIRLDGRTVGGVLCAGRFVMKTRRGVVGVQKFNLIRGWELWFRS